MITARIVTEGEKQQADAIWGLAGTSIAKIKSLGLLISYAPANLAALKPVFRDKSDPPPWIGMEVLCAWLPAAGLIFTRERTDLALSDRQSRC